MTSSAPSPVLDTPRAFSAVLVTGGAGFIGSAFIRTLYARPDFRGHVVNLDSLTYAGNLENLAGHVPANRYTFAQADIKDQARFEELLRLHNIDVVVHFAAESHVDRSIHGPRDFLETNVMGTFSVLEALRSHRAASGVTVHLHHVSTDEVFGSLPEDGGLFTETTAYDPKSPYSASKAASDHLVRAYAHTYGLPITVSNCSNNYGPCQFPEKLIPLMILNCLDGKPLPVYGDGRNVRDWLYVDDHADAVWQVMTRAQAGTTWNVGGNNEKQNIELLHELIDVVAARSGKDAAGLRALITSVKDRPGHDRRYAIDTRYIQRHLGWTPVHDFAHGLEKTVQWYLDNQAWIANVKSGAYRGWLEKNYAARA